MRPLENGGGIGIQSKQHGTALSMAALREDKDTTTGKMLPEGDVNRYLPKWECSGLRVDKLYE